MLSIQRVGQLAKYLGVSEAELIDVADKPDRYCEELILLDPAKPGKQRQVLQVCGKLRAIQRNLYHKILMPKLVPSEFSHGGVRGRHIKSNLHPHLRSRYVLTMDISNFYPSIPHDRVYKLFVGKFRCHPDVARICTKVCTYQYHLALGLVTSPVLADQIVCQVDERIGAACHHAKLAYTRYVDDLTISGPFDLAEAKSGFAKLVERVLNDHGFRANPKKSQFGRLSEGIAITKITVKNGHPDVRLAYLVELKRQLDDVDKLAAGGDFEGPYYTRGQLNGRIQFVCWINPSHRKHLLPRFRAIDWEMAEREARKRGLVAAKKTLARRDDATELCR